ncbi:MAG: DUF4905 domain-containing protein [Chlorobium sp.]|uniref:DUF4905 domain-containing protein n=1 Tax=Chlorobium sp. TaxID=1095 RepID=UPI0025BF92F6|nr:DUF4905 domain-containing protein [Chlorobium sp.]MCF8383115.1 DUF4905 domain-containing protein [Chlorobium sp.]
MKSSEQVSLRWVYNGGSDARIWRLSFTRNGLLVCQKRCLEGRSSLFFVIEERSGRIILDNYLLLLPDGTQPAGEGWFTGIETVSGNLAYLHAYQENSPEHLGLWAVSPETGLVVWSHSNMVYCGVLQEGLLVYIPSVFAGFPERRYLIVDPLTGAELRRPDAGGVEINALRERVIAEERRQEIVLPDFAPEGSPLYEVLQGTGIAEPERCECIATGSFVVAASHDHDPHSGRWRSVIRFWLDRQLLHEDVMSEKSLRPALNSFLLHGRGLYYMKGESELVAMDIRI